MPSYLIRTIKHSVAFGANKFMTAPYRVSFDSNLKDYNFHYNEYVVDLDELEATELAFIVNCIVHAERMLHVNTVHLMVSVFDLAHYFYISASSGCLLMFPTDSTEQATIPYASRSTATWGKRSYWDFSTGEWRYTYYDYIPAKNPYFRTINQTSTVVETPYRTLTVGQNVNFGYPRKVMYRSCVLQSDVDIMGNGSISMKNYGELLHTRYNLFYYYMRFAAAYMSNNQIDKDGYLIQKQFSYGKLFPLYVSDMKTQYRKKLKKSNTAVQSYIDLFDLIYQYHQLMHNMIESNDTWGYNLDIRLPPTAPFSTAQQLCRKVVSFLISRFPYLVPDEGIDSVFMTGTVLDPNKYLIPNFEYSQLQELFNKFISCYYYFENICSMMTFLNPPKLIRVGSSPYNYFYWDGRYNFGFSPALDEFHHNRVRYLLINIKENIYKWRREVRNMQYMFGQLERMWNVDSYNPALDNKPPKRTFYTTNAIGRRVSSRVDKESGVNYPRRSFTNPTTQREKDNSLRNWQQSQALPLDSAKNVVWMWGGYDLFEPEIIGGDLDYSPLPVAPPNPPSDQGSRKRPFVWDNTIHPLDPEDEDAEAIAMLEEVEENLRAVGHAEWGIAKAVAKRYKIDVPPAVSVLVDAAIDVAVDQINPTDRPKVTILKVPIEIGPDGKVTPAGH